MGQELEWKYAAPSAETLDRILADEALRAMMRSPVQEIAMRTTYYDTPDRLLSAQKWMLRQRMENETAVVCCKTPLPGTQARAEWEVLSREIAQALPKLAALGAPAALLSLRDLRPTCSASFQRRAVLLSLCPGCTLELACDLGELSGETERMPLCEVELELKEGDPAVAQQLADALASAYALTPEARSKAARAMSLG